MLCIECGAAADFLYEEFSKGNIRLNRCSECGRVVDKYVEYDNVLILLDLVLLRLAAYRHLLFNRQVNDRMTLPVYVRMVAIYSSLETWIKWTRLPDAQSGAGTEPLSDSGPTYVTLLTLSLVEFVVFYGGVGLAVWLLVRWRRRKQQHNRQRVEGGKSDQQFKKAKNAKDWASSAAIVPSNESAVSSGVNPDQMTSIGGESRKQGAARRRGQLATGNGTSTPARPPLNDSGEGMSSTHLPKRVNDRPSRVDEGVSATAPTSVQLLSTLVVSSFGKLLFFLAMAWRFDVSYFSLFDSFVVISNVLGVQALLNCSFPQALLCICSGVGAKQILSQIFFLYT